MSAAWWLHLGANPTPRMRYLTPRRRAVEDMLRRLTAGDWKRPPTP